MMRSKPCLVTFLALFFACAAYSAVAQAVPAATNRSLPLAIGIGLSGYDPAFGHGCVYGGTLWIDYALIQTPSFLRGIGVEVAARDLNYGQSSSQPGLREDVAEGGVIYSWQRSRRYRPYGKFLMGYGNKDGDSRNGRWHDSRNITSLGGGMDFRATQSISVRADYEYQFWPDMVFKNNKPVAGIRPQGLTIGVLYRFNAFRIR
jgi:opacity protein-like surface antigen